MFKRASLVFVVGVLGLTACSTPSRLSMPTPLTSLSNVHSVSYTDSGSRGVHAFNGPASPDRYRVCIEPSPDTAVSQTENFDVGGFDTTARRNSGQYGGIRLGGGGEASASGQALGISSIRTNTTIDRERAIEVFRETLFQSCMAYAQGVISAEEYGAFLRAASGGALTMAAMAEIAGGDGPNDQHTAEIMSTLAQIGLFGLLLTDSDQAGDVQNTLHRLAELKADQLEAMIELIRAQAAAEAASGTDN